MTTYSQFKLAAVQAAPVYFDREASTEKACRLIQEAGAQKATLAAFGECWLPGYPFHIWGETLAVSALGPEYLANAVDIPSPTTEQLCDAARLANIDVVIGMAERDARSRGTVYCTLLFIGNDGTILGRHRKLKPTHRERTVWGEGDGSSLVVYERPYGLISGLNCWEHNMVLPGYALMDQGTQVHIAAWPGMSESRHSVLSRAFASQAAAYVIDVGAILAPKHVTGVVMRVVEEQSDEVTESVATGYPGESSIIDPWGEIIAGPAESEQILLADCSEDQIFAAKAFCDVAGHYSRPDVFQLHVNRAPHRRVVEMRESEHENTESEAGSEK